MKHHSHDDVSNRLKRARGHLEKVIAMIESEEPCLEVSRQLHAVSKAIQSAKKIFIGDHIEHCLDTTVCSDPKKLAKALDEFKEISKYLD